MASIDLSSVRFRKSTVICPVMSGSGTMFNSLLRAKRVSASFTSRSFAEKEKSFCGSVGGVALSWPRLASSDFEASGGALVVRLRSGSGAGAMGLVIRTGGLAADGPLVRAIQLVESDNDISGLADLQPPTARSTPSVMIPTACRHVRAIVFRSCFMQIIGRFRLDWLPPDSHVDRRRVDLLKPIYLAKKPWTGSGFDQRWP